MANINGKSQRNGTNIFIVIEQPGLNTIHFFQLKTVGGSDSLTAIQAPPPSSNLGHPPKFVPKRFSDNLGEKKFGTFF